MGRADAAEPCFDAGKPDGTWPSIAQRICEAPGSSRGNVMDIDQREPEANGPLARGPTGAGDTDVLSISRLARARGPARRRRPVDRGVGPGRGSPRPRAPRGSVNLESPILLLQAVVRVLIGSEARASTCQSHLPNHVESPDRPDFRQTFSGDSDTVAEAARWPRSDRSEQMPSVAVRTPRPRHLGRPRRASNETRVIGSIRSSQARMRQDLPDPSALAGASGRCSRGPFWRRSPVRYPLLNSG